MIRRIKRFISRNLIQLTIIVVLLLVGVAIYKRDTIMSFVHNMALAAGLTVTDKDAGQLTSLINTKVSNNVAPSEAETVVGERGEASADDGSTTEDAALSLAGDIDNGNSEIDAEALRYSESVTTEITGDYSLFYNTSIDEQDLLSDSDND